jgi:hypothetical protein
MCPCEGPKQTFEYLLADKSLNTFLGNNPLMVIFIEHNKCKQASSQICYWKKRWNYTIQPLYDLFCDHLFVFSHYPMACTLESDVLQSGDKFPRSLYLGRG